MRSVMLMLSVLVVALMFCCSTQAQDEVRGITGKGIKLGSGWTNLGTNTEAYEGGTGARFTAGVFVTYNFTSTMAIQPELLYVGKGTADGSFFGSSGFRLEYLEMPILMKYKLSDKGKIRPSFYLGPALSVLLGAELYSTGGFFSDSYEYDVKNGMKSLDVCITLGGEIEFGSFKSTKMTLDIRYTYGLTNAVDPAEWNASREVVDEGTWWIFNWSEYDRPILAEDTYIKTRVLSLMFGIRF